MRRALALGIVLTSAVAHAHDVHVTAVTPSTIYIDAGTTDGLSAGAAWQALVDGRVINVRVAAVASHDAELEVDGARPAVGSVIALPPTIVAPPPVTLRAPPAATSAWRDDPAAIADVQHVASHQQPARPTDTLVVSGELALSVFVAGDVSGTSTSSQDLSLASQLQVEDGAWRYDHVIDAHLAAAPELFSAPLQHAQARFDIYLMRLAYAPSGARYATALGRQPAAPMGELGTVDGGKFELALGRHFDLTAFAGLRPASDLGLSRAPRVGADLGWQVETTSGLQLRADTGVAVDEYLGAIDRALAAMSASLATRHELVHTDASFDLATDANGIGPRLTRLSAFARTKRGRITGTAQLGYDRPFWDRALVAEAPDLLLGPRTFAEADATYALRSSFDVSGSTRVARGNGFMSTEVDLTGAWHAPSRLWQVSAAPFVVVGSLVDAYGVRASVTCPLRTWSLGVGGSFERVAAAGELAWAETGRLFGSRALFERWRTALSAEVAAGDGPTRVLLFGLLAYRFGS